MLLRDLGCAKIKTNATDINVLCRILGRWFGGEGRRVLLLFVFEGVFPQRKNKVCIYNSVRFFRLSVLSRCTYSAKLFGTIMKIHLCS